MDDERVSRGPALHRRTGDTFYYTTRLLPGRVREAVSVLHGFFPLADEVVDSDGDAVVADQPFEARDGGLRVRP